MDLFGESPIGAWATFSIAEGSMIMRQTASHDKSLGTETAVGAKKVSFRGMARVSEVPGGKLLGGIPKAPDGNEKPSAE
jgi:hypothetical protein